MQFPEGLEDSPFTTKDPPCIALVQFLLIKCPQQIRKYTVDTSLELKYSLANNEQSVVILWVS